MAVLKGVKLSWAKLRENHPEKDEDGNPSAWCITAEVDKKTYLAWKKKKMAGIRELTDDEGETTGYCIKLSRKIKFKNGDDKPATEVFDKKLKPINVDEVGIGNGSIGNVQYATYDYEYKGKKGVGVELVAVQITELVEYAGGGMVAGSEFEVYDTEFDNESDESTDDDEY